ncbi:MAG: hypothetical protein ABI768_04780 [Acidobacteriota bacterium]
MVTFLTLILGIAVGVHTIEVQVGPAAAFVEFQLDGKTLHSVTQPPWKMLVDFGRPVPHELVAIARDEGGAELGRAVQFINVPRPNSEAMFALLPGKGGRERIARLTYASAFSARPESIELTFDGQVLDPGNLARIRLPDFRAADVHVLRGVLEFKGGNRVSTELLVGGVKREAPGGPETMRGEAETDLTAVPVVFKGRAPKESEMDGWFLANGEPVRVEGVEESPGEIVVVKDENAGPWIAQLRASIFFAQDTRYASPLRTGQRLRFCWPGLLKPEDAAPGYDVFMRSQDFVPPADVRRLLIVVTPPEYSGSPRLGDAVGVAALSAAAGNRPRAVVLVVAGPDDESLTPIGSTRAYLRALRVPLFVWAKNKRMVDPAWGKAEVLSDASDVPGAVKKVTKAVEAQRIVWLEGRHLPQSISLSPKARKVTLVE